MKLHLPSGLRKALMACLAALALPSLGVSTTIASASGIAAAFAALSAISASQARAEQEYTWSDTDGSHKDTFSGTVFSRMDSAEGNNPGNSGNSGLETLELADTSNGNNPVGQGADSLGKFWNTNDNVLTNTLQIKKLDSETGEVNINCNWNGNFRLGGLIVDTSDVSYRIGRPASNASQKQAIIFQAEEGQTVKGYIGSSTTLVGRSVAVNSNSDWKIAKGKTLSFTGNADSVFTIGDGVSVNLSSYGTAEGAASVLIEMGLTMSAGSSLTLGDGVSLTFAGGDSTLTSLDLTSGGQVTLAHGKLTVQEQITTDATHCLNIAYSATNSPQLRLSEGWSGELYLTLTDFTDDAVAMGYALFDVETWDASWGEHIHITFPEGKNWELDSLGRLAPQGADLPSGWPPDSEFGSETFTAANELVVSQSGTLTYGSDFDYADDTVTLQGGGDEGSAINVKITESDPASEHYTGTLSLQGHIGDLLITGGQFHFDGGWRFGDGATIKNIYVKDAMLYLEGSADFQAGSLHLGGRSDVNSWEGALRLANNTTVTLSGSLFIEDDTLISVQTGSVFRLTGELATGGAGASHNLLLGSHSDSQGDAHVELLGGGTLQGTLGFSNQGSDSGGAAPYLVLGKGETAEDTKTLTVYGLNSSAGGYIVAGGEGEGNAELVLNGTESYAFNGMVGASAAPGDILTGWDGTSALKLTVNLGSAEAQQSLSGHVHVGELTISGGKLYIPDEAHVCIQVDGDMVISGTGSYDTDDNGNSGTPSTLIVGGDLIVRDLDTADRTVFDIEGKGGVTNVHVKGRLNAQGNFRSYGDLALDGGGELRGTLTLGWGGGLTLGADLSVDALSWDVVQGVHFKRKDGIEENVFVLKRVEDTQSADFATWYNNFKAGVTAEAQNTFFTDAGIGFGKTGDGTLTLTGSGDWSVDRSFKVAGGKLEVGAADSSVNMWFTEDNRNAGTLVVEGGELVVHGQLGGKDNGLFKILGGGRVTVSEIVGQTGGHSSGVILGDANDATSIGTLTVTTGNVKLHDLTVIGKTGEGDVTRSTATFEHDLSIWSSRNVLGAGNLSMDISGGQVTVRGKLYGTGESDGMSSVRVTNEGILQVEGASALFQNLNVDNGTVTVGQLFEARGNVQVNNDGQLTVDGMATLSQSGSLSVGGGTVTLNGGLTVESTGSVSVSGGAVTVNGAASMGSVQVSGGVVTLNGGLTGETVTVTGGELALGGAVSSGTLRLEDGKLTLGTATAALGSDLTLQLSLNAEAKLKGSTAGASGRTITLQISANEVDMTRFTENRYHLWDGDKASGVTVHFDEIAIGRGTLSYDDASGDLVLNGAEQQTLTWEAGEAALTWQSGESGTDQWTNSDPSKQDPKYKRFYDGDNVTFTGDGSAKTVTLGSDVRAWDMAVNSGGWIFDTASHSLTVSHEFTLGEGASVVFQGTGSLQVASANVGNGTVTFKDSTISHYGPSTFYNEADATGKVILDFGSEVTLNAESNLFAALFAGGDATVQRDAEHVGIGQVEVESGTQLHFEGGTGATDGLVRRLVVKDGASVFWKGNNGYNYAFGCSFAEGVEHSVLELNGSGAEGAGAAFVWDGGYIEPFFSWDLAWGSDATLLSTGNYFNFGGGGKFVGTGHVLTFDDQSGQGIYVSQNYGAEGTGVLRVAAGDGLIMKDANGSQFGGFLIRLEDGAKFTVQDGEDLHIAGLSGTGDIYQGSASRNGNRTLYLDGGIPLGESDPGLYEYYDETTGYTFTGNFEAGPNDQGEATYFFTIFKTGSAVQTVEGDAILQALTVSGGEFNVAGRLGLADSAYNVVLNVTGGASVKAGYLRGPSGIGHAGVVYVGAADSSGSLEIGTEGQAFEGDSGNTDIFRAKGLWMQGAGSSVTVHGDTNFYSQLAASGAYAEYALVIEDGGTATFDGSIDMSAGRRISVESGSTLTVKKSLTMQSGHWIELDGGTITLGESLGEGETALSTAGIWFLNQKENQMTVNGNVVLGGGLSNGLGDATIDGTQGNLTIHGNLQVNSVGGTFTVKGGADMTIDGNFAGDVNSGNADTYFGHGHAGALVVGNEDAETKDTNPTTVTVGTEGGEDELLQVRQLTVYKNGELTVHGNLSASYGDAVSIQGSVKVDNDMVSVGGVTLDGTDASLTVNGAYKGASGSTAQGGAITLTNGAHASMLGGLHSSQVTISGSASELTVGGTVQVGTFAGSEGTVKVAEAGADFAVGENGLTLDMTFVTDGHRLTKSGAGTLTISKYTGWAAGTQDGSIAVQGGTLNIVGLAEAENNKLANDVTVAIGEAPTAATQNANAVFSVEDGDYTVGTVHFTGGSAADAEVTANGTVRVASGSSLTIDQLDLSGGNGSLAGADSSLETSGALTVKAFGNGAGSATHGLRVGWKDTALALTLGDGEGNDLAFAGGLYLANQSRVTLTEDMQLGWLGGDATATLTQNWNDVGGTISSEVARTLTLTGTTEHVGGNYTIDRNITLKLGAGAKQTFTGSELNGSINLGEGSVLAFRANGQDANTVSGQLSGSGTLQVQGKEGDKNTALQWAGTADGYTGTLSFAGANGGILELQRELEVGDLQTSADGGVNSLNGEARTLKLNYAADGGSAATDHALTLGAGVTLEKVGDGTFQLQNVGGDGKVKVSGGTLVVHGNGWEVKEVEVVDGGTLSAATANEVGGTVKLNGGTLSLRGEQNNFEAVNVAGGGSTVTVGSGNGTLTIGRLTGGQNLAIEGTDGSDKRVVVGRLENYTGTITGTLNMNGLISMQSSGSSGSCHQVVVSYGAELRKRGSGSFSIDGLRLEGTLWMTKEGELTIGSLTGLGQDAALAYDKGYMDNGDGLLRLELSNIIGCLSDGDVLGLDVDTVSIGEEACNEGFCLGIHDETKEDGEDKELVERFGLVGNNVGKKFDLMWKGHLLYLAMDFRKEDTEYDANWGLEAEDENHRGPGIEWMGEHAEAFTAPGGALEQLLGQKGVTDFTGQVLSLAGIGTTEGVSVGPGAFYENRGKITGIRLTKGDEAAETYLSVVGGSVFRGEEAPTTETRNSFIVLKADDATANHFHLLVGGSSCVSTTAPESPDTFVGFNGNTHLQVEGGTVDYIIGGNHVTNTFFGFQQKDAGTFISVYDGNGGGVKSEVRGGIVGGSVITWSDAASDYHDFEGDTHIFIYTLLGNPEGGEAPRISDGTSEGASAFAAVVGGNVWIDVPTEKVGDNIAHTFNGATNIFVNLLDGKAIEGDTKLDDNNGDGLNAAGKFEKAIVGGNYTVPKEIGGGAGERKSVFQGVAGGDGDDTHITIYATEDHTFTAGINGASRRDAAGSGSTQFVGDTYVELHGGNYTDIVAGGMWYQAPGAGQTSTHVGSFEGNTKVELFDGNYFRVAGGNVSLEGGKGSLDTFTGASTVIIHDGTFGMPGGEAEKQTDIAFVAGGSFYRSTEGSATHKAMSNEEYLTQLQIDGGTFNDVHLVGGDYINTTGVNTQERSEGPKIDGNTQVVIGSGEEGAAQPEITGVVVGGSYLTDDGEGGSAIITGNTNVEINGGTIKAEVSPGGTMHAHSGVAVVAGSMLIDDGTTAGGHTVQIGGDTNLIISGGDITGLVVGGSYTSDSAGVNTIDMQGAVNMQLKGGTITGNIIGGHYSDNTENPDQFTLGNVTIDVAGSTVHGLIFGGSFRRAEKGSVDPSGVQQHPQQGAITVKLTGGTVAGGVYAAGNHYNTAPDAQLHVHTARTEVEVTGDMEFTQFSGMTAGGEQVNYEQFMLSGGYQRNVTARQNLEDYSTVGYTEGANPGQYGTWAEAAAQLHFSDKGGDDTFANITRFAGNLRLQDFDAVNVDEGLKVDLSGTVMRVMHKVAGTGLPEEATNHDSFIKQGKGDLVLKGLRSWNAQKYDASTGFVGTEEAYEGLTVVEGGHLVLRDSGGTQSLLGGLGYDVRNLLATGKTGDAYLRAEGGLKLSFAGASSQENGRKVTLQLRGATENDGYLAAGWYRLADGVDWSTFEGLSNPEEVDPSELKAYFNVVDGSGNSLDDLFKDIAPSGDPQVSGMQRHFSLEREEGGDALVLRVMMYSYDSWVWWGDDGGTWRNDSTENWSRSDGAELNNADLSKNDVYFFDGALTDGQVTIDGTVTPNDVYVRGGSYTFAETTPGSLRPTGSIIIGEEENRGYDEDEVRSTLELNIDGSNLHEILVHVGGRLSVANPDALKGSDAKVTLKGGTLMYAERDGALAFQSDLSDKLTDQSVALRIQVGNSALAGDVVENAKARSVPNEEGMTATWSGKMSEKTGIRLGVTSGIIQSGRGVFHFVWDTDGGRDANGGEWGGTLRSREGKLVVEVTGGGLVAIGASSDAQLSAENDDAELQLVASNGTELTVSRGMSGSGTVTIGADELAEGTSEGSYTLDVTGDREKDIMRNNFTGTLRLLGDGESSTVQVAQADALGHDKSTLALAGRALTFTDAVETATVNVGTIEVEDNTTNMLGGYSADAASDLNKSITLKVDKMSGNGVLANARGGFNHTIIGTQTDTLGDFTGTLVAGQDSSWTLELAKGSTVSARLAGTGTIRFTLANAPEGALEDAPLGKVRLDGAVGDEELGNSPVLVNDMGEGTALVLASTDNSSTGKLVFNGNEIWLGDDDGTEANWEGKNYEGNGAFVLKSGTLSGPLTTRNDVALKVITAKDKGSKVDVKGTAGSMFKEVVINENGHLTGVSGPITVGSDQTKVTFVFTDKNQGEGVGKSDEYLVESSGNLVINDASAFTMDFSNEALLKILLKHRDENLATYLHLISGAKISFGSENQEEVLEEMLRSGSYAGLLDGIGFKLGADGGDLVLYGSSASVYLVLNETSDPGQNQTDPHTISDPKAAQDLSGMKATLVDEDTTLSLDLSRAGDVTINNLVGLTGSSVSATGEGTVELHNQKIADPLEQDGWLEDAVPDQQEHLSQLQGQDTRFDGKLTGGEGTTFRKTGQGTLTVGDGTEKGGLNIAGDLQLRNGDLVVKGMDSHIGSLVFDYGRELDGDEQLESKDGLVVQGGKLTVGGIEEETSGAEAFSRNRITLKEQGEIVYSGNGKLESTTIASDGTGLLTVGEKSSLALAGGNDQIKSVGVNLLEQSTLDIGKSNQTVNELKGTGTLKGGAGSSFTVKGGSFSGTLAGTGDEGAGKLVVANGATFTLDNARSATPSGGNAWDVQLDDDSKLKVDVSKGGDLLALGDVDLGNGSMEVEFGNQPMDGLVQAHIASRGTTGSLSFRTAGEMRDGQTLTGFTVSEELRDSIDDFIHFSFDGAGTLLKDYDVKVDKEGQLVVTTTDVQENRLERAMPNAGKNGRAGATMMWDSLKNKSKEDSLSEALHNPGSAYAQLTNALIGMYEGQNAAALERTLTSAAGASVATLAPAFMEDMHRQLKTIRNRTTTMGSEVPVDSNNDLPLWHAWISGEGGYHKLDADGYLPGFTLNSWGGTVGVDIDVSQAATFGLALSAMYGDLKTDSADSATGDLDTTYLSAFLRASSGAWVHTFVVSGGRADIGLDRTVNYGSGSYRTKGSTDGYALGALYEVGYTSFVNGDGTFALQPVFNVEARHASIKGYVESDSDAGLRVGKMRQDVVTLGAGACMQSVVGGRALNRTSVFEARALVKADLGDRSGVSDNAIAGSGTYAEVESAEVGAVGIEIGAGITIPLGTQYGSIFMDASLEWRQGWTSADASVGYRINF